MKKSDTLINIFDDLKIFPKKVKGRNHAPLTYSLIVLKWPSAISVCRDHSRYCDTFR